MSGPIVRPSVPIVRTSGIAVRPKGPTLRTSRPTVLPSKNFIGPGFDRIGPSNYVVTSPGPTQKRLNVIEFITAFTTAYNEVRELDQEQAALIAG